jgi:oligoendopeptidase F
MGLKISEFKKGGVTFTDAYAKVSNVNYNNDTKIASFGLSVFSNKEDKNKVSDFPNYWVKVSTGEDMVAQCYGKIDTMITQSKARIVTLEADIAAIEGNDSAKYQKEAQLAQLQSADILQLDGAIEW